MYTISVQAHYDAAHRLRHHKGKCARLHGHRYVVEVTITSPEVGENGMVCDFADVKAHLRDLVERFDHQCLEDVPPFTEVESTAENQARFFFDEMKRLLPEGVREGLRYARVSESPGQWAQYGA
jgi:6-pyruvoyltetrahydropterin/6-carboxytetrahydropterin synthase